MKRLNNLKDFRIYLIELTIILCIFFMCKISLYYNQKEATERGRHIHILYDTGHSLKHKQTKNANTNHDRELDHTDTVN